MGINSITGHKSDATSTITNNVLILFNLLGSVVLSESKKELRRSEFTPKKVITLWERVVLENMLANHCLCWHANVSKY